MNLRLIINELRQAIRSLDTDVVFLQEVIGERIDSRPFSRAQTSQFEFLADEVWHHHAYGKNSIYQKGHHGNAILSKWPLLNWDNIDVSHWWFSQRGILLSELSNGVYAVCIHLGLLKRERKKQLKKFKL
jgi:endonuclease/exonuclease/phosphatase family metal-dependent hydrolase